ncbi:MAG: anti-sigma factor family protein, partial [Acidobacteriaceae bacterium]
NTDQVAEILGLQPGTVRVRLHRARLSVRREIDRALDSSSVESNKMTSTKRKRSHAKAAQRPAECRDLFANLSEYLDGRIGPVSCEQMRQHIDACPACVAFLRDLRLAIDRCRSLQVPCDPAIAPRLRSILTQEYLRMLGMPTTQ